jgi:hypothetical protein
MKSKSKIVLGLSAILAVSAGVAGVSTFAWFTTSRTATVTANTIKIGARNGALEVTAATIDNGGFQLTTDTTNAPVLTGTDAKMSDVSGDGKTFYTPTWTAKQGEVASAFAVATNSATVQYYREFTLNFHNAGTSGVSDSINVYLQNTSKIQKASDDTKDVNAQKAMRVAIYDGDTCKMYWQDYEEPNTAYDASTNKLGVGGALRPYQYNYVSATKDSGNHTAYGVATSFLDDATAITNHHFGANSLVEVSTGTETGAATQLVCTLAGNATKALTVRVWIEGTSAYCLNDTTADDAQGVVKMNLDFVGI